MSPSLQPSGRAIRHSHTIIIISLYLTFCARDRATDWGEVAAKARRRKDKTCPICIGPSTRKRWCSAGSFEEVVAASG